MSQYQRLLLIINPTLRHSTAINHAAALARASGGSLHIAALVPSLQLLSLLKEGERAKVWEGYMREHKDWLDNHADNLRRRGIEVTVELNCVDDMPRNILDHVAEMHPDLLIKEVAHESALKRAFFTPLDWRLLRHCPVPLYLLGGDGPALPRKIVAAVDSSDNDPASGELNDRIIHHASSLALQCQSELHVLHAYDTSSLYQSGLDAIALSSLYDELKQADERSFLELAKQHGVPTDRRHFVMGQPVSALSEFVNEHHMDVIVMGRVQYCGLEKFLGSTTEHILYQVPCSVLAV